MDSVCRVVHLSLCYKALPCAPEAGQRSRRCGLFLIVSTILWIHSTLVTEASRSKICFQLDSYTYKFHSSFTAQYVLQKWSARAVMKWCNHLLHRDTCYDIFGPSPQIIIIIAFINSFKISLSILSISCFISILPFLSSLDNSRVITSIIKFMLWIESEVDRSASFNFLFFH